MRFPKALTMPLAASVAAVVTLTASVAAARDDDMNYQCVSEAAALTQVAGLAYNFGSESDVLSGALSELREQLTDCLVTTNDAADKDTSWQDDANGFFEWSVHDILSKE